MSENDVSIREHRFLQNTKATFHSETLAPLKEDPEKKPRFSVEPLVYVAGVGWEVVDPMAQDNEFMIAFRNYVRIKELMGYRHTGLSSDEITQVLENLWGKKLG